MTAFLKLLGLESERYNELRLRFAHGYGVWYYYVVAGALLLGLFWSWYSLRNIRVGRKRKYFLFALRCFVAVVIALVVLQPQAQLRNELRIKNKVAVLFDSSMSMSLPAPLQAGVRSDDGQNRAQAVTDFLNGNEGFFEKLAKEFDVDCYTFSDALAETSLEIMKESIPVDGPFTDIVGALQDVYTKYEGAPLRGMLLFSDGADTVGLPAGLRNVARAASLRMGNGDPALPAARGSRNSADGVDGETPNGFLDRRVKIYTIAPGDPEEFKDVAISGIKYDDFAFVRNPWTIKVRLTVDGYDDRWIPITLKQGDRVVMRKSLKVTKDKRKYSLTIDPPPPTAVGRYSYTVSARAYADEAITLNNERSFTLRVVRDKIRILHVCGRPSWDARFLRRALKKEPSIDLIAFFILRTINDNPFASRNELSLIEFPTDRLFIDDLNSFDLVIFQNFDYRPYTQFKFPIYFKNIRNFVIQNGGAFLMIGGDIAFSQGGYNETQLEDILPFKLAKESEADILTDHFKIKLTQQGMRHPIMALDYDPQRNLELWNSLPEASGCNEVQEVRSDAVVLATHPTAKNRSGPLPIIAVREVGEGRSMAVTIDSSWRWNFLEVAKGGSNRRYLRFWKNAIRWLIKDPELKRVRAATDRDHYQPNDEVQIKFNVFGKDYSPLPDANIAVEIWRVGSKKPERQENIVADSEGEARLVFRPQQEGNYRIRAVVTGKPNNKTVDVQLEGNKLGVGKDEFDEIIVSVETPKVEFEDASINAALLKEIARATDGQYFQLPLSGKKLMSRVSFDNPKVVRLLDKKDVALWHNWGVFLVIIALLSVEWFLRRRWGLS